MTIVLNVKDPPYNAQGDWNGSTGTDDTAAIRQAVTDARTTAPYAKVFFPPGRYRITKTGHDTGTGGIFKTANGVVVEGSGKDLTEIVFTGSGIAGGVLNVFEGLAGSSLTVRHLKITGPSDIDNDQVRAVIHRGTSGDLTIEDCYFQNVYEGAKHDPGSGTITIRGTTIYNTKNNGVLEAGSATFKANWRVTENRFDTIGIAGSEAHAVYMAALGDHIVSAGDRFGNPCGGRQHLLPADLWSSTRSGDVPDFQ